MNAEILSIGDELLIGQVVNTNAAWLGRELATLGLAVTRITAIADTRDAIVSGFLECMQRTEWLFTTGGLGPTRDDVTRHALQEVFGGEMVFSDMVWEQIEKIYAILGKEVTDDMREQCYFPSSAQVLPNKMGTAPGLYFEKDGCHVCVMPGVPYEMEYLTKNAFAPVILGSVSGSVLTSRTIATAGEGETNLARQMAHIENALPDGVSLAYLPAPGRVRIRVTGRGQDEKVKQTVDRIADQIASVLGDLVFAQEDISQTEAIGRMLIDRQATVALAESCTGGYLAHLFTAIPGSSAYFAGGAVTYSNALKQSILGVRRDTLDTFGAVSEETAREMAAGARNRLGADYAVAITGIAGPDGGTPEKPVGTVWMAVADAAGVETKKRVFGKDRLRNIELSAVAALDLLRRRIQ